MSKPWYTSKTVWANLIGVLAAVAASFGLDIGAEEQGALSVAILAVVNIVLRLVTNKGVTL